MNITWHGQSCFQIVSSQGKDSAVRIVIDPFDQTLGLKVPKLEADILLVTHSHHDHNNVKAVSGNPFVIDMPGEFEIKGAFVQGIPSFHDSKSGTERGLNTIYVIETEDMRICHLGDLGQKELTSEQIEEIGDIDVLMVPVGGVFTLEVADAVKVISQIEPSITIPMHYDLPGLKTSSKLEGAEKFLKSMGVKSGETLPKLSVKKKDISAEEAKIIVLSN
ncbi:MAG: MBL fold metallo-hydrolase [Candidatus Pacebacteria bacterium]|nr:MBL fold metallo-hydrolase [Candidatus Paceibacterota bacterium]